MNKEEIEAIELKKQQGCKIAKCGVVDNNIRLRIENIKLKKQVEQLENKVKELKNVLDERFIHVTRARTVYGRLMQLSKEIIVKDDLKLRNEIEMLLKEKEILENKVKEQDREKQELIEILKKDISACKSEIITVQNGRNRNELKGSERRRLASVSGRQNEAIRILNLIGGKK